MVVAEVREGTSIVVWNSGTPNMDYVVASLILQSMIGYMWLYHILRKHT